LRQYSKNTLATVCLPVSCRVGDTCVVDDFGIRVKGVKPAELVEAVA